MLAFGLAFGLAFRFQVRVSPRVIRGILKCILWFFRGLGSFLISNYVYWRNLQEIYITMFLPTTNLL